MTIFFCKDVQVLKLCLAFLLSRLYISVISLVWKHYGGLDQSAYHQQGTLSCSLAEWCLNKSTICNNKNRFQGWFSLVTWFLQFAPHKFSSSWHSTAALTYITRKFSPESLHRLLRNPQLNIYIIRYAVAYIVCGFLDWQGEVAQRVMCNGWMESFTGDWLDLEIFKFWIFLLPGIYRELSVNVSNNYKNAVKSRLPTHAQTHTVDGPVLALQYWTLGY